MVGEERVAACSQVASVEYITSPLGWASRRSFRPMPVGGLVDMIDG